MEYGHVFVLVLFAFIIIAMNSCGAVSIFVYVYSLTLGRMYRWSIVMKDMSDI